jgi:3-oxoacyl-[acyl-carrier-protein] synthase II
VSRAVITGVGVVSAFGVGADPFLDGLARGRSAVGPIRSFDASAFPVRVAGEVPVAEASAPWVASHLPRHGDRIARWGAEGCFRDRKVAFALLAADEAWRAAGCGEADRDAGLSVAFGIEHTLFDDLALLFDGRAVDWKRGIDAPLPPVRIRTPFDLGARVVLAHLGLAGPVAVHASACAGGALAVAHAAALVERGVAPLVLCGASDSMLEPFGFGGFCRLGALSPRDEPDACRPFDRRRDGLAMGEGAAMFVVEDEGRARARGARPLAAVLGWGSSQDGHRLTAPRPDGAAALRAMSAAVRRAGVEPGALGYVNAHGTGTPLNDVAEARALRSLLGAAADRVPVSSVKGAVGHLMAASGAIELAACLLPFERGLLPGTAHHRERDPECEIRVLGEVPAPARPDTVLSNSFGFGGQNACVVLGRCG